MIQVLMEQREVQGKSQSLTTSTSFGRRTRSTSKCLNAFQSYIHLIIIIVVIFIIVFVNFIINVIIIIRINNAIVANNIIVMIIIVLIIIVIIVWKFPLK